MPTPIQRLELTWIEKDQEPRLEPRILLENPDLRCGAPNPDGNWQGMLIHGDNLLALKALEAEYSGKVKCIYIDPPFNTGQAFEHYDDGIEHSIWLSLIRDRLKILHKLLSSEGSIFIHIDDNELGYLIVLLDEIFGRRNRVSIVTFKQGAATGHKSINPGLVTTSNFLLAYAKEKQNWEVNRIFTARERNERYNQFIINKESGYLNWEFIPLGKAFALSKGITEKDAKKNSNYAKELDQFVLDNAEKIIRFARPDYDGVSEDARKMIDISKSNRSMIYLLKRERFLDMYFYRGERILFYSDILKVIDGKYVAGEPLTTIWDDLLSNNLHKEGGVDFPKSKKPESLIKRILELATSPNDLVLDSFLGSGTTAAVAHKMGRRWIGIELGEHAYTHCVPRLQKVVRGLDPGGITKAVGWAGGGGFRVFALAPTLLQEDRFGQLVINPEYNAPMLAAAVCRHEGFRYAPDPVLWWKQGRGAGRDYLLVTTRHITRPLLDAIHEEMQEGETLLVCCRAFDKACADAWPDISLRKIPNMLFERCEWGRDDYSLHIVPQPGEPSAEGEEMAWPAPEPPELLTKSSKKAPANPAQGELF